MASKVYFTDMHTELNDSLMNKLGRMLKASELASADLEKKFVAIKVHFGEYGNLAYLRPNYVKVIADFVRSKGGIPFATDCNTLYVGMRKNAVEHLENAALNGFNPTSTGCQIIIGDGLKGTDDVELPVNGQYVKTAKIGRSIADADFLITLNHFKCHEITGIGGALKNLGMGCASRRGKMELHTSGKPSVEGDKCRNCKKCAKVCAQDAFVFGKTASIDQSKCAGCGRCIGACPFDAIVSQYDEKMEIVNAKIVEYSKAIADAIPSFHVTVLADVSPFCDCHSENDTPIIPNVGIFASSDPVAIDRACVDKAQEQPVLPGSALDRNCCGHKPQDIFAATNPSTRWQSHFEHAERMGMGDGAYELVNIR